MRNWILGLSVLVFTAAPAPAADDDATATVKKAIDAHGGAEALNKYKAGTSKLKGELSILGMDLEFTGEIAYQLPDKFKIKINSEVAKEKLVIEQTVSGKQYKQTVNGMDTKLSDEEKTELAQNAILQEVDQLTPLLDAKKFTLKAEKDAEVDGKPAAVVLVTAKGLNDTKLFFDKKTNLLVKTERKALAPGPKGDNIEVVEATFMSDYKKVQGVMTAMKLKVQHDGKDFMTMNVTEVKLLEKIDPKTFAIVD